MEPGKFGSAELVYKQVGYEGHKTFHKLKKDLLLENVNLQHLV